MLRSPPRVSAHHPFVCSFTNKPSLTARYRVQALALGELGPWGSRSGEGPEAPPASLGTARGRRYWEDLGPGGCRGGGLSLARAHL